MAVTETGRRLHIPAEQVGGGVGRQGLVFAVPVDVTEGATWIEWPDLANLSLSGYAGFAVRSQANDDRWWWRYSVASGELVAAAKVDGLLYDVATLTFDEEAHRWWRIENDDEFVYFSTSPGGVDWTTQGAYRIAPEAVVDLTGIFVEIYAGHADPLHDASPGFALADNLNRAAEVPTDLLGVDWPAPDGRTPWTQRWYEAVGPAVHAQDPVQMWLAWMDGTGHLFDYIDALVAGHMGWGEVFNVDTCPPLLLPYLAQYVGVRADLDDNPDSTRARLRARTGWKRGGVDTMRAEVQQTLSGSRSVRIVERDTSAYHFSIFVFDSEAPSVVAGRDPVVEAIERQKPAGLQYTLTRVSGMTYGQLDVEYGTYDDMDTAISDYYAQETAEPEAL